MLGTKSWYHFHSMMKYKGYIGQVEYDSEAKLFHGEVIGLKDTINMIIAVGSQNRVKVEAVKEAIAECTLLAQAEVVSFAASSGVTEQPVSLEEIIQGAKNRAYNAFAECQSCTYSFGLESGLFKAPGTMTGFLEASICSIFDGTNHHIGLSCGFEVPPAILELVLTKNLNLSEACHKAGITEHIHLGSQEGLIGLLTNGKIDRKQYTKQSIITALIQIEHSAWYKKINNTAAEKVYTVHSSEQGQD